MNSSNFSLQFELNVSEIQKLNKMYLKNIYKDRVLLTFCTVLFFLIFCELRSGYDLIEWTIRSLVLIVLFMIVHYFLVNSICKIIFRYAKRVSKSDSFVHKYRFHFTDFFICIHSPLGDFTHKWSKIEKAILTKDFLFLYFKERNGYIISISNKCSNKRNMEELISFVESNVIHVIKV